MIFVHDWLSTLCIEWHSTVFGWFIISSLLLAGMSFVTVLYLVSGKYNQKTGTDISKYLFAFSCIWMYLWYSQFTLIWYTNIRHETFYLARQFFHFKPLFYANLIFSFGIPFILLLSKTQKRNKILLGISAVSALSGQWINLYLIIFPPVVPNSKTMVFPVALFIFMISIFIIYYKIQGKPGRVAVHLLFITTLFLSGCNHSNNHPGYEYVPTMTYPKSFETYSVNPNFTDSATMRNPVAGTIPQEFIPYRFSKKNEERALAGEKIKNPLENTVQNQEEGKFLFESFCLQCHGEKGDGMGKLYTEKLYGYKPGILNGKKIQSAPDGEIFHVISLGYNLMGPHKTVLLPEERWKIVLYIKNGLNMDGKMEPSGFNNTSLPENQAPSSFISDK
jgi:mono/diheme cytochrome c family protein